MAENGDWQSFWLVADDQLDCIVCGVRIEGDAWVKETGEFTGPEARCAKHGTPESA